MARPERQIEIDEAGVPEPPLAGTGTRLRPLPLPLIRPATGEIRTGKLAGLTMWHAIWVISWPVLIESLLQSLVGVTDTMLAAGVSEAATDAIGGAAYFMWFVGLVSMALGVGATALISRAMGKGRPALGSAVVGQCALMGIIGGIGVALFVAATAPVVSTWLNLKGEAHQQAVTFIRVWALAVPAQTFLSVGIACWRGAGDSVRPLVTMAIVNVVNLTASFTLAGVDIATGHIEATGEVHRRVLIHNPFGLHLGVTGIATGTCIAWTLGGLMMLGMLVKGAHGLRLRAKRLRPHWHTLRRVLRIGLPNFLETFGMWLGNFLTILMVGWMNNPGMLGAHIIAARIEAFSFLPGFAMGLAAATLAGQYLGAGSPRLARTAVLRCTAIAAGLMGMCGAAFLLTAGPITGVFSQQPTHLELVPKLLMVAGAVQVPFALSIVFRSALRGAGDTRPVMWITWISTYLIRMPLAWILCGVDIPLPGGGWIPNPAPLQGLGIHPLVGFWMGLCGELVIRGALFTIWFLKGTWTRARV